jgi:hypothetical protein
MQTMAETCVVARLNIFANLCHGIRQRLQKELAGIALRLENTKLRVEEKGEVG